MKKIAAIVIGLMMIWFLGCTKTDQPTQPKAKVEEFQEKETDPELDLKKNETAQQSTVPKDVSIYGVTIGKTLAESGILPCENRSNNKSCYDAGSAFPIRIPPNGLLPDLEIEFKEKGSTNTPVVKVYRAINWLDASDRFVEIVSLLKEKFGPPSDYTTRPYHNPYGTQYDQVSLTWNIGGNKIYVVNFRVWGGEFQWGLFEVTYKDLVKEEELAKKKQKEQF